MWKYDFPCFLLRRTLSEFHAFQIACRNNAEYRAVDLCQHIASQKVVELAIKYATAIHRQALAKKLQSIAENRNFCRKEEKEKVLVEEEPEKDIFADDVDELEMDIVKEAPIDIRPLPLSQGLRRSNPFSKARTSAAPSGNLYNPLVATKFCNTS